MSIDTKKVMAVGLFIGLGYIFYKAVKAPSWNGTSLPTLEQIQSCTSRDILTAMSDFATEFYKEELEAGHPENAKILWDAVAKRWWESGVA